MTPDFARIDVKSASSTAAAWRRSPVCCEGAVGVPCEFDRSPIYPSGRVRMAGGIFSPPLSNQNFGLVFTKICSFICRCPQGPEKISLLNGALARTLTEEEAMPRLKELDTYELNEELVAEFADGYEAMRADVRAQKQAVKQPKKALQKFRNEFVAQKRLYTPPVEFALELKHSKSPDKRREWLRGFAVACRVLGLHDQGDLFSEHMDPGEVSTVAEAAA